jgi:hypothetical protein
MRNFKSLIFFICFLLWGLQINSQSNTCLESIDFSKVFWQDGNSDISVFYERNGEFISNMCGDQFGYKITYYFENNEQSPVNVNYSFSLVPRRVIDIVITSTSGFTNFNNTTLSGIINTTLQPSESYCGVINVLIPSHDYANDDWVKQQLLSIILNNANNTTVSVEPPQALFVQGQPFRRAKHYTSTVNSSQTQLDIPSIIYFHQNVNIDCGQSTPRERVEIQATSVIFPNPTSHSIQINSNGIITNISIIDLNGKLIKNMGSNTNNIDVSHLQNGMYIIKYEIDGVSRADKFIKIN